MTFGDETARSFFDLLALFREEEALFQQSIQFLFQVKEKTLKGGLGEWDAYLRQPEVKDVENAILQRATQEFCNLRF